MRLLSILTLFLITLACTNSVRPPGQPLIAFDFNCNVVNQGLANVLVQGGANVNYGIVDQDTCLDLSEMAIIREPLTIRYAPGFSFDDYSGFSVSLWVQKAQGDQEEYTILSQERVINGKAKGWKIKADRSGAWSWEINDSLQHWIYTPTRERQAINNDKWHQITFTLDRASSESRLYFDGDNVAVYSIEGYDFQLDSIPIRIGISPLDASESIDVFNGKMDDISIWSRALRNDEVQGLYCKKFNKKFEASIVKESFKVMTWDIWQGGIHEGKHVGPQRVLEVLKGSDADLIMLQEMAGTGPALADGLGFYYFQRNENLGLLSRFPLLESKNVYRPENAACVKIDLGEKTEVYCCPIALSEEPRMDAYIRSDSAVADTIEARELDVRGKEVTFILGELRHILDGNVTTPVVLGGGFYSGSHLDWTENNKDQHKGLVINYPVSMLIEKNGFVDTYRFLHPDEKSAAGHTWSTKFNSFYPNRTDFIYYIGIHLTPIKSYLIEDHLISFPSSHAAVITEFEVTKQK